MMMAFESNLHRSACPYPCWAAEPYWESRCARQAGHTLRGPEQHEAAVSQEFIYIVSQHGGMHETATSSLGKPFARALPSQER